MLIKNIEAKIYPRIDIDIFRIDDTEKYVSLDIGDIIKVVYFDDVIKKEVEGKLIDITVKPPMPGYVLDKEEYIITIDSSENYQCITNSINVKYIRDINIISKIDNTKFNYDMIESQKNISNKIEKIIEMLTVEEPDTVHPTDEPSEDIPTDDTPSEDIPSEDTEDNTTEDEPVVEDPVDNSISPVASYSYNISQEGVWTVDDTDTYTVEVFDVEPNTNYMVTVKGTCARVIAESDSSEAESALNNISYITSTDSELVKSYTTSEIGGYLVVKCPKSKSPVTVEPIVE